MRRARAYHIVLHAEHQDHSYSQSPPHIPIPGLALEPVGSTTASQNDVNFKSNYAYKLIEYEPENSLKDKYTEDTCDPGTIRELVGL
jgi:hypothetical protein